MQNAEWSKIKETFYQVLDLPVEERETFLASQSDFVRSEVLELISSHENAENFIAEPALIEFGLNEDQVIGKKIDDYLILKEIGTGGMGKVYLAEREGFEQKFALKLIKRGMDTDSVLKRFIRERQILSRLEHQNIARLLNAGSTKDGLPYFVMEYVEGEPITRFCASKNLSANQCLEIFQKVCSAVSYAHQNLIVHRDLKPSNILVTADGVPKLLDFGIAKLLNSEVYEITATQARLLTPEYASPEQINGLPITTATDVYSLGVVLYEILSGQRPFSATGKSYQEIAALINTKEPVRPSSVVSYQWSVVSETQQNKEQRTKDEGQISSRQPQTAIRNLKGDLDNIILKSLRKETARRYNSVSEFSEDIRRYLVGLPVTATADTRFYRFSKFVKRNKLGAAIAVLVLFLSGAAIWQGIAANREKSRAEKRFNQVRKLANSILFDYYDGIESLPGSTSVREKMVKDALEYLDNLSAESGNDPSLQSELATAFQKVGDIRGNPYLSNLGDMNGALSSYQKALSIRQNLVSANPNNKEMQRLLAISYGTVADIYWAKGENANALENYKKALAIDEANANENPADKENQYALAFRYYHIGQTFRKMSDLAGAVENFNKSLEINRQLCSAEPDNKDYCTALATSYLKIGDVHFDLSNYAEALSNHQKAIEALEPFSKNQEDSYSQRMISIFQHRTVLDKKGLGDFNEAIKLNLEVITKQKRFAESDPKNEQLRLDLAESYLSLGSLFFETNKFDEAVTYLKKTIVIFEDSLNKNPDDAEAKQSLSNAYKYLGDALLKIGKIAQAEDAYKKSGQ